MSTHGNNVTKRETHEMLNSTPRTLYHSVLQFRCNNKLIFCLCKTCAIEQNTDVCTHETVADRDLIGFWVTDEIRLAVRKGYRLIKVFEVYEYEVTQYDPTTGQGGLFVEYINNFLKLKTEASGYPSWVRTPEDDDSYINPGLVPWGLCGPSPL